MFFCSLQGYYLKVRRILYSWMSSRENESDKVTLIEVRVEVFDSFTWIRKVWVVHGLNRPFTHTTVAVITVDTRVVAELVSGSCFHTI